MRVGPGVLMAAALGMGTAAAAADVPVLTVLTYDSFVSEWGPGPAVEAAFEASCGCDVRFVTAGDGAALLARVRLEGARGRTDVVLGLDTNLIADARSSGLFAPHDIAVPPLDLPIAWSDDTFVPFDWGWFAFVHGADLPDPPTSFRALADSDLKLLIEDPRSSTPGLGLLLWVKAVAGDDAGALWRDLADNIVTVTPGWSEAYGLFLEGEADMVLSYTTSPAYHRIAEDDPSKEAALFDEGNYLQVEVAGIPAAAPQPALARDFLRFMLGDAFQGAIPTTNWMYPAVTPAAGLPEGFDPDVHPSRTLMFPPEEVPALRDAALAEWRDALSR